MASARQSAAARSSRPRSAPAARQRPRVVAGGARGIRWDRVGRVVLLIVLFGVVALYVGPSISFISTWRESKTRTAELQELKRENRALQARKRALGSPQTLEREARRLGLVKPGERPFIVKDLPSK